MYNVSCHLYEGVCEEKNLQFNTKMLALTSEAMAEYNAEPMFRDRDIVINECRILGED